MKERTKKQKYAKKGGGAGDRTPSWPAKFTLNFKSNGTIPPRHRNAGSLESAYDAVKISASSTLSRQDVQ